MGALQLRRERQHGLMYRLPYRIQLEILDLLLGGMGIRATARHKRVHPDTIMRLLVKAGQACDEYLDLHVSDLRREYWEIDEMWTFCRKKEKRLTPEERATNLWGDQYLFLAIGQNTKFIPCYLVGKRNAVNAGEFMRDLAFRFRLSPILKHRLSTDGFMPYIDAVAGAFGKNADYGMIVKNYKGGSTFAARNVITGYFSKDKICTSHMERGNLTIRTFMRRFTRRALGFSKKLRNLRAAVALQVAHYNFCWRHSAFKRKQTPAMAAKLTQHIWGLDKLLEESGALRRE